MSRHGFNGSEGPMADVATHSIISATGDHPTFT